MPAIVVIIPAYNEALSIAKVIRDIPKDIVREMVVVDNNSTDATAREAKKEGASVLTENRRGYGHACLAAIEYIKTRKPDIVVFMDGDYSDYPEELPGLVKPIIQDGYDLVIGSRVLGQPAKGALLSQQRFGNWLAITLIRIMYRVKFTDLGPFRAIRFSRLLELNMQDTTYGWTVEMQVKAAKQKLRCCEIPVSYRKRIGVSKISGTMKGTLLAGYKILLTIFRYW